MKKAVILGERQAALVDVPTPEPKQDWALVKVHATPMCTEYKMFLSGTKAAFLGHEAAGEVVGVAQPGPVQVGDRVVVMNVYGQRAVIRHRNGRFAYEPVTGDPLMLASVLAQLSPDCDGYYDARELLVATAWHIYPAPLQRLWEGHFTVVDKPANVLVSLRDDTFTGSDGFAGSVNVASTHGSLNRQNTTAFIMSTAGPMQRVLRSKDVAAEMTGLLGRRWPMGE